MKVHHKRWKRILKIESKKSVLNALDNMPPRKRYAFLFARSALAVRHPKTVTVPKNAVSTTLNAY